MTLARGSPAGAGRARLYVACFVGWTAVGLFFFTQALYQKLHFDDPTPWWHSLVSWMLGAYLSALFTPLVLWLGDRFPLRRSDFVRATAVHLAGSVGYAVVQLGIEAAILAKLAVLPSMVPSTFVDTFRFLLVIGFHGCVITYWVLLGIQHAVHTWRRYQEREKDALRLELHASALQTQLARAQLSALKMQLQPHFLFNTLNAIMVLVRQQRGPEAEEMIGRFSDLLRCVLDDVDVQEVPLRRELEYLTLYLSIEEVRFQDRLHVELDVDPAVLDAALPHMVLQPIVENAIRHGIGRSSTASRIRIVARRADRRLELAVEDDGPGLGSPSQSSAPRFGIGLSNTSARLAQLYGESATLTLRNGERGGAVATIALPYRLAREPSNEVVEGHATDRADRR